MESGHSHSRWNAHAWAAASGSSPRPKRPTTARTVTVAAHRPGLTRRFVVIARSSLAPAARPCALCQRSDRLAPNNQPTELLVDRRSFWRRGLVPIVRTRGSDAHSCARPRAKVCSPCPSSPASTCSPSWRRHLAGRVQRSSDCASSVPAPFLALLLLVGRHLDLQDLGADAGEVRRPAADDVARLRGELRGAAPPRRPERDPDRGHRRLEPDDLQRLPDPQPVAPDRLQHGGARRDHGGDRADAQTWSPGTAGRGTSRATPWRSAARPSPTTSSTRAWSPARSPRPASSRSSGCGCATS